MSTIKYLSESDAINGPKSGFCKIISNSWWAVDPEKGLIFYHFKDYKGLGSPQCNTDYRIVEMLKKHNPDCEVKYFDRIFVPIDLRDYTDV